MLLMEHNPTDNHARPTVLRAAWTANDAAFEAFKTVVAIHIWIKLVLAATYLLRPMWCYYETAGKHAMVWYKMSFNSPLIGSVKMFSFSALTLPWHSHVFVFEYQFLYLSLSSLVPFHSGSLLGPRLYSIALTLTFLLTHLLIYIYWYIYKHICRL